MENKITERKISKIPTHIIEIVVKRYEKEHNKKLSDNEAELLSWGYYYGVNDCEDKAISFIKTLEKNKNEMVIKNGFPSTDSRSEHYYINSETAKLLKFVIKMIFIKKGKM